MKTLIVLGATNVFLGFTSFILSNQITKSKDGVQRNDVVIAAHRSFKLVKSSNRAAVINSPGKKNQAINIRPLAVKKKIKPPVIRKKLIDQTHTIESVALQKESGLEDYNYMQLMDKAEKLEAYAKEKGYSTEFGFLINMGMKSGKKRFFVVDLSSMVIIDRGLVAHGSGKLAFTPDKTYSNEPGSNCTSLGIYEVGKLETSAGSTEYQLVGLEESNSNASKRAILLKAMDTIPENEIECPIFQSKGSPTIAPAFLANVSSIIEQNEKPVLMWIFDTVRESELVNAQ